MKHLQQIAKDALKNFKELIILFLFANQMIMNLNTYTTLLLGEIDVQEAKLFQHLLQESISTTSIFSSFFVATITTENMEFQNRR